MNKLIIYFIAGTLFLGVEALHAQRPTDAKPAATAGAGQSAPREGKTVEKREELSKKLLQRKDELRKEDHERAKERRNADVQVKPPKQ